MRRSVVSALSPAGCWPRCAGLRRCQGAGAATHRSSGAGAATWGTRRRSASGTGRRRQPRSRLAAGHGAPLGRVSPVPGRLVARMCRAKARPERRSRYAPLEPRRSGDVGDSEGAMSSEAAATQPSSCRTGCAAPWCQPWPRPAAGQDVPGRGGARALEPLRTARAAQERRQAGMDYGRLVVEPPPFEGVGGEKGRGKPAA